MTEDIRAKKLAGRAKRAFKGSYPRFAATVDNDGMPNVVPLLSLVAADDETLVFSRLMIWKTAKNLEANGKITVNSLGYGFKSWTVKGKFIEYQSKGEYVDFFNSQPINRYNAYMGVNKVGVIKILEVYEPWPLGFAASLWKAPGLKNLAGNGAMPENPEAGEKKAGYEIPKEVLDKFNRRLALKYFATIDKDGMPLLAPQFSMRLAENGRLILAEFPPAHPMSNIEEGGKAAASVLTMGPVSYQVKGTCRGAGPGANSRATIVDIEEVYTASPPVPGKRIIPPEPFI